MSDAPLRILVVDDNPDHRFLTRRAIKGLAQQLAVEAEAAEGGVQALARLGASGSPRIDLVLLDLKMPGMDGIEVLEALRKQHATAALPVILFSSSEQKSDRARAMAAGADAVVTKPIGAERFLACIQETVLDWARGAGRLPR